jgi:phage-related protein
MGFSLPHISLPHSSTLSSVASVAKPSIDFLAPLGLSAIKKTATVATPIIKEAGTEIINHTPEAISTLGSVGEKVVNKAEGVVESGFSMMMPILIGGGLITAFILLK